MVLLNLFAMILGLHFAAASEPEYIELQPTPRLEITFAGGIAQQTGYLTSANSVGAYVVGVNMGMGSGLMTFEWNAFTAKHDTNEFAFANNKDVKVSAFSFIPQIRVFEKQAWNIYAGFGLTQVGIQQRDPEYSTVFGTFIASGLVRYRLNEHWSAQYKSQWYGVRQTMNGQETLFDVWSNTLGVGYTL